MSGGPKSKQPITQFQNINEEFKITIPQALTSDHQATVSLHKLIQKLGAKTTLLLYDSLLSGKRILISGDTK